MTQQELDRKLELEKELKRLELQSAAESKAENDRKQFERFIYRPSCAVTGRAHACDTLEALGISVAIPGNSGERYSGPLVTSATRLYFHNVWTHQQRLNFTARLNKFILDEIKEVIDHPVMRLEIMGLQANDYFMKGLSKDIADKMRDEIRREQFRVLDGLDVSKVGDTRLAHSSWILSEYNAHKAAIAASATTKRTVPTRVSDRSGKPAAKRGLVAKSATRRGTPKQRQQR